MSAPAPWTFEKCKGAYGAVILDAEENGIAECAPANAPMITAAPAMLAALRVALKQITDLDEVLNQSGHDVYGWHMNGAPEPVSNFFAENDHNAAELIRAAIAAATGAIA